MRINKISKIFMDSLEIYDKIFPDYQKYLIFSSKFSNKFLK